MAEKMPERITAFSVSPLKSGGYWSTAPQPPMEAISDYIRADLVDDAVKALEEARKALEPMNREAANRTRTSLGPDIDHWRAGETDLTLGDFRRAVFTTQRIDAALTRIKGDVT